LEEVAPEEYEEYGRCLLKFAIACLLKVGTVHGDLHTGNILFLRDPITQAPQLGLIDWGIVVQLNREKQNDIFQFLVEYVEGSVVESAHKLLQVVFDNMDGWRQSVAPTTYQNVMSFLQTTLTQFHDDKEGFDISMMMRLFQYMNEIHTRSDAEGWGLHVNREFMKLQLAVAMAHACTLHLCQGRDYVAWCHDVLEQVFYGGNGKRHT
jgi:predicted unusual protein kinase regulating ubiquinone biosynthesis (AarF/ABC1/UbiB family)